MLGEVDPVFWEVVAELRETRVAPVAYERPQGRSTRSMSDMAARAADGGRRFIDTRSIEAQADPAAHMAEACGKQFPAQSSRGEKLPSGIVAALRAALGAGRGVAAVRNGQAAAFKVAAARLAPLNERLLALRPEVVAAVPTTYHVAMIAALGEAMEWPDEGLVTGLVRGFPTTGEVPDSGLFRPVPAEPEEEFWARHDELMDPEECLRWAEQLEASLDAAGRAARGAPWSRRWQVLMMLDEATAAEVKDGLCGPAFGWEELRAAYRAGDAGLVSRIMARLGVPKGDGGTRPIENALESLTNLCVRMHETAMLIRADMAAQLAAEAWEWCREQRGRRCPELGVGFADLLSAYRLIPTSQPQNSLFAYFSPAAGRVVFHELRGHNFGLVASVTNFARVPHFHCAVLQQWFAVPVDHYVDDYYIVDLLSARQTAHEALSCVHELTGSRLAPLKAKPVAPVTEGLGVRIDVSKAHLGRVVVSPLPRRLEKILGSLAEAEEANRLLPEHAQQVAGQLGFVFQSVACRAGRGATQPLFYRAAMHPLRGLSRCAFGPELRAMREFLVGLLDPAVLPGREIDVAGVPECGDHVVIYSDATGLGGLGAVLLDLRKGVRLFSSGQCPGWMWEELRGDDKMIVNQLEGVAVIAADLTFADYIRGRRVWHFVDNGSTISAVVNGYSGKPEMAHISNVCCILAIALALDKWYEHVAGPANVADLPSRREAKERSQQWIQCLAGFTEVKMVLPTRAQWRDPLGWLRPGTAAGGPGV